MDEIFSGPIRFINLEGQRGYAGYAMSQAKKYGIKGSRLGVIKKVKEWLEQNSWEDTDRLGLFLNDILNKCADANYCREIICNGEKGLSLCGSVHLSSTPMYDFFKRIKKNYDMYGTRAEDAMKGQGIDWKALSHAVRALFQMQELAETGKIIFPLKDADTLVEIKKGLLSWPETEKIILEQLKKTDLACDTSSFGKEYDVETAENIVLSAYGESPKVTEKPKL